MKIAFVFGKGIDGCGVTRGAVFYENWLAARGHTSIVVDFDNGQSFARAKEVDWLGEFYEVTQEDTIDSMRGVIDAINSCDIAVFHSHPTRKQGAFADRYREMLSKIDNPIVVMHDHSIAKMNINAVPQACELFAMADVAVVQSMTGYSIQAYTHFDPGLAGRVLENPIWIDPQKYDAYRKSFKERSRHFLYMGRMSPLKDPGMICRIQPHMDGWDLSIIGCESSIASVSNSTGDLEDNPAPYIPEWRHMIMQHTLNRRGAYSVSESNAAKSWRIKSYDRYRYDWGMNQLGSSFASWCGYKLSDPEEYGHRMEYTMIESYLLTLPIINRHFAENARSPEGKTWGEYDCTLISQAREERALAEELNRLLHNEREWCERTAACRELIHKFNNIDVIGQQFLDRVLAMGKRKNKIVGLDRICEYFPSARARRAAGQVVMSSANGVLTSTPMILVDGKQSIVADGA